MKVDITAMGAGKACVKRFVWASCIACGIMSGCVSYDTYSNTSDYCILSAGSTAFDQKASVLLVSPDSAEQAVKRLQLAYSVEQVEAQPVVLYFLLDDWYGFSRPSKEKIHLTGFYVNGSTGAIEYRHASRSIEFPVMLSRTYLSRDVWKSVVHVGSVFE